MAVRDGIDHLRVRVFGSNSHVPPPAPPTRFELFWPWVIGRESPVAVALTDVADPPRKMETTMFSIGRVLSFGDRVRLNLPRMRGRREEEGGQRREGYPGQKAEANEKKKKTMPSEQKWDPPPSPDNCITGFNTNGNGIGLSTPSGFAT